eukprot:CAMPEP_0203667244 /NCGR_PEP_ID=MMETSP0090-20130426/4119_1 /ASSEMBLY_ACC=CAM_ASM_001088 /TAXON_ID=426623 /ORGANISM="Chaetoceros affinis, Strain CCMP159" /LENGTH=929 /DNA_ID=CAMNT_0050531357 /DNA_START=665 /DNA_END=3454 /DNA_ORIENTATION=-
MGNKLSCRIIEIITFKKNNDNSNSINNADANSSTPPTQRENMATWYRVNIAVTDVYEILRTLGHGRMGEVYHVRRLDGGRTHTEASKKKEEERQLLTQNSMHSVNTSNGAGGTGGGGGGGTADGNGAPMMISLEGDLDASLRSLRSIHSASKGRGRNRGGRGGSGRIASDSTSPESLNGSYHNNRGGRDNRDRSRSPFAKIRKRGIAKKNAETLAAMNNSNNSTNWNEGDSYAGGSAIGNGDDEQPSNWERTRKDPPDLRIVQKPKPILKYPKHGSKPSTPDGNASGTGSGNNSTNGSGNGSDRSGHGEHSGCDIFCNTSTNNSPDSVVEATGMTALITGKALKFGPDGDGDDSDDDDDSVPMNMNAVAPVSSKISTPEQLVSSVQGDEQQQQEQQQNQQSVKREESVHAMFAIPDDGSVVSEVTMGDETSSRHNNDRVSIVTGDEDPKRTEGGTGPKKWVPRRRVFFRRHYACKTIATNNVKRGDMEELLNEIYMMRKMDHPYIIRLYEVYQVQQKIWLVMDLCDGGPLNSRKLGEQQVTVVAEQILRGVAYLHRRGICHRDLKMENILYENKKADSPIRLIDFGLSLTYDRMDTKQKFKGAAYTLSPEVLDKKPYTEKSDMWSIGVIIWIMLAGDYPFIKEYDDLKVEETKKKLLNAKYSFGITWRGRGITEHAKAFVKGCLHRDPEDRWSALQALTYMQDTWIPKLEEKAMLDAEVNARIFPAKRLKPQDSMKLTKERMPPPTTISATRRKKGLDILDQDALESIKRYATYSLFRKTILVTMANTMDSKDVGELQKLFLMIDTNQSGSISLPELQAAFNKDNHKDLDDEVIENIFKAIDYDSSGDIHYKEFVAAFSESQGLITYDRLTDTFDRIDSSGKGYILHDDLKNILGENYNKETVDKMIEEGDFKKNGQVDFEEFLQLMYA